MDEKNVAIGGVTHDDALDYLSGAPSTDTDSIANAVPKFKEVDCYSFKAEWALVGEDIQVKFYLPKHSTVSTAEARQVWMKYWIERFPAKLDIVARAYFEAEYPRLVVKWTDEFASWWFRASSYAYLLDTGLFLQPFFEKLDQALREKEATG